MENDLKTREDLKQAHEAMVKAQTTATDAVNGAGTFNQVSSDNSWSGWLLNKAAGVLGLAAATPTTTAKPDAYMSTAIEALKTKSWVTSTEEAGVSYIALPVKEFCRDANVLYPHITKEGRKSVALCDGEHCYTDLFRHGKVLAKILQGALTLTYGKESPYQSSFEYSTMDVHSGIPAEVMIHHKDASNAKPIDVQRLVQEISPAINNMAESCFQDYQVIPEKERPHPYNNGNFPGVYLLKKNTATPENDLLDGIFEIFWRWKEFTCAEPSHGRTSSGYVIYVRDEATRQKLSQAMKRQFSVLAILQLEPAKPLVSHFDATRASAGDQPAAKGNQPEHSIPQDREKISP